jgi:RNA polymerase sigma-70 factor, ECF subfamily
LAVLVGLLEEWADSISSLHLMVVQHPTPMSDSDSPNVWYTQQVVAWQPRLYGFALSLTGNTDEADDVLQNANLTLLRKQDSFQEGTNFGAWARQIVFYEVQRIRASNSKARKRFDKVLLDQLASKSCLFEDEPGLELKLLRKCMDLLSPLEREMLGMRYGGHTLQVIAEKWNRTAASISQTLYRIRLRLAECIDRALKVERRDDR